MQDAHLAAAPVQAAADVHQAAGVRRDDGVDGAAVLVAAAVWGLAIVGFGFSLQLSGALACLVLAGAADAVSGLFRMTIWNETIPTELRGRLAGVEMISYLSGPLLGNARAGWVAPPGMRLQR